MSNRLLCAPAVIIPERTIQRLTDAEFWDFMAQHSPSKATFYPFYRGPSAPPFIVATGGTIVDAGNFRTHTFLTSANFTITNLPPGATVEALVVAGGASPGGTLGASANGPGAGGGGEVRESSTLSIPLGVTAITVGAGGTGGTLARTAQGNNGADSVIAGLITAKGGGGGGAELTNTSGKTGGPSGGGASAAGTSPAATSGSGGTGHAFAGAAGTSALSGSPGGGGGAGGAASGITGGVGYTWSVDGLTYGKGGNARSYNSGGAAGVNASANTGDGGGGSDGFGSAVQGNGGSGIVKIRYQFQ